MTDSEPDRTEGDRPQLVPKRDAVQACMRRFPDAQHYRCDVGPFRGETLPGKPGWR